MGHQSQGLEQMLGEVPGRNTESVVSNFYGASGLRITSSLLTLTPKCSVGAGEEKAIKQRQVSQREGARSPPHFYTPNFKLGN